MYPPWAYAVSQAIIEIPYVLPRQLYLRCNTELHGSWLAAIVTTASSCMFNLFSGFFVLKPHVPKWWPWFYYLMPTSWTINGMLTSQHGDVQKEVLVFGKNKRVSAFLEDYFRFHHDRLAVTAIVFAVFPIAFASLFAYL
ncbi:hypothetical protein Patl1_23931 [Pistacia atlantica]|uniref:Uncharacterized protein n=1 Tax=Pistacia atlantica TaxID=434234 RepID=A0ACC1A0I8_9ROSI|nr:hypothetical protein Patl1_23931 [Pistacia atlantica]